MCASFGDDITLGGMSQHPQLPEAEKLKKGRGRIPKGVEGEGPAPKKGGKRKFEEPSPEERAETAAKKAKVETVEGGRPVREVAAAKRNIQQLPPGQQQRPITRAFGAKVQEGHEMQTEPDKLKPQEGPSLAESLSLAPTREPTGPKDELQAHLLGILFVQGNPEKGLTGLHQVISGLKELLHSDLNEQQTKQVYDFLKEYVRRFAWAPVEPQSTVSHILFRADEIMQVRGMIEKEEGIGGVKPLSLLDAMKLGFFIEAVIKRTQGPASEFFGWETTEKLPRSVLVDREQGTVTVFAHQKISHFKGKGSYKVVADAAKMTLKLWAEKPEHVAGAFTKTMPWDEPATERDLVDTREEYVTQRQLQGPGIAEIHSVAEYTRTVKVGKKGKKIKVPKVVATLKIYKGSLEKLKGQKLTLNHQVQIALGSASGIKTMHNQNVIHGDMKLENVLFNDTTGKFECRVSDFGLKYKKGEPLPFRKGNYGSSYCTAPELFMNMDFKGDGEKLDVWALGLVLYQLNKGRDPPWMKLILDHEHDNYENEAVKDQDKCNAAKKKFTKMVEKEVEGPFKKLDAKLKEKGLNEDEQFEYAMYSMLRLDPNKRVNIGQAIQMLTPIAASLEL